MKHTISFCWLNNKQVYTLIAHRSHSVLLRLILWPANNFYQIYDFLNFEKCEISKNVIICCWAQTRDCLCNNAYPQLLQSIGELVCYIDVWAMGWEIILLNWKYEVIDSVNLNEIRKKWKEKEIYLFMGRI